MTPSPSTPVAPADVVKSEKAAVFVKESTESAEGLSLRERTKLLKKNINQLDKIEPQQQQKPKVLPKMDKERKAKATEVIKRMVMRRSSDQKETSSVKESLEITLNEQLNSQLEDALQESNISHSGVMAAGVEATNEEGRKTLKKDAGMNLNNYQGIAKMGDKDRIEAYKTITDAAKKCKGTFSMTGAQLNDDFVKIFVQGALSPGANPNLTAINLEGNLIRDVGIVQKPNFTNPKL
eukprot:CAMPEP_0184504188 /NCGR_PEP_ID=MMETSP0113_2-20130426/52330_1 /TAXON_ID=91329 /ORGANISM="Norrisiella sphaerica, Strain BC52" /LENGTH=236 /DNA_ID=CAMNT_0026893811 /DNA_START=362 /DNA_END=1072 /DNA_ORIENTATION=-